MSNIYTKDSFDRFGDDLCEDIFSSFPLEECIKYECVSQQWMRTVFQRVNELRLNFFGKQNELIEKLFSEKQFDKLRSLSAVKSLLIKCPNITHFYLDLEAYEDDSFEDELFTKDITYSQLNVIIVELIAKYCPNLRSINNSWMGFIGISAQTIIQKIEHNLESICFFGFEYNFEAIIGQSFSNVRRLNLSNFDNDYLEIVESLLSSLSITRLTHLKIHSNWNTILDDFLKTIIHSNNQLKCLDLKCLGRYQRISTEDLLTDISRSTQLKSLSIRLAIRSEIRDYFRKVQNNWSEVPQITDICFR